MFDAQKYPILAFLEQWSAKLNRWMRMRRERITVNSLTWMATVLLHLATVPSLLGVMMAWTDQMPQLDLVIMIWAALAALFAQAMIQKNSLLTATNAAGFMMQCVLMALIFFR
jgi:hypothetical protein